MSTTSARAAHARDERSAERLFGGPGEMRARCRALDWAATPFGPVDRWPEGLRAAVRLCLGSDFPMSVLWGPELAVLYNDGYRAVLGPSKHPAALGRPGREVWPEVWAQAEPQFAQVLAGGPTVWHEDEPFAIERGGRREVAYFTYSLSAITGEDGVVGGVLNTAVETTARVHAEERLRQSEARARALVAHLPGGAAFVVDHDLRYVLAEGEALQTAGLTPADLVGKTIGEALGPEVEAVYAPFYRRALSGEPFVREHEDHGRVYVSHGAPLRDGAGRVEAAIAVSYDVTGRKRAEAAVRESEARQAFLVRLGDALRPLADPAEIQATASRLLGEHLGTSRTLYAEVVGEVGAEHGVVRGEYAPSGPPMPARVPYGRFGEGVVAALRRGEPFVSSDVTADPHLADAGDAYGAADVVGFVAVPLVKAGRWVAVLGVHTDGPREWSAADVELVREVAERTWAATEHARAEAARRESEARFRAIVEGARDYAILTTDPEGRITSWAPGAEAVFGWPEAEALGQPAAVTFTPEDRAAGVPETERAAARAAGVAPDVRWHQRRDGARVFIEGTARALYDEAGGIRGFLKVGQDVTRRRALDEALRASEARYRTLVDNVRDYAIFLLDAEGIVTEWAPGAERVKGWTAADAVGQHLSLCYPPEAVAAGEVERELAEAAATGRIEREGWRVRKDGTRFWADEIMTAVRDGEGRLVGFTKIARDLTDRRLAEAAAERAQLAAARDALRRRLAAAEEAERRRLARELHDQLGQELTAFRLGLDDAARLAAPHVPPDAPLMGRLAQLGALAQRMTAGARYLALELRPPELDDVGLESALETYAAEWAARYGVAAEVAVVGTAAERPVPAEVGSALYRIAQEALTNVAKHAGASHVSVIVEKLDGGGRLSEVRLIVEDDGRGFDVEAAAHRVRAERRLGLAGMRERAALAGGTVAVESSPGAGTTLYVRLPTGPAPAPPDRPAEEVP